MLTRLSVWPGPAPPAGAPPCSVCVKLTWAVLKDLIRPLPPICRLTVVA